MKSPIRVLIFHKTRFLADALHLLLSSCEQLALVVTSDAAEAQNLIKQPMVDVVLLYAAKECEAFVREIKTAAPPTASGGAGA